jgi:hypothetical protein
MPIPLCDTPPIDVRRSRGFLAPGSAVQEAAEHLLMDIAKLESEKVEKAAKR